MCRNHSHIAVQWAEQEQTPMGERVSICVDQPLTLEYKDGRKLTLRRGVIFSVTSSMLVGLLVSAQLATGGQPDFMSLFVGSAYVPMDTDEPT